MFRLFAVSCLLSIALCFCGDGLSDGSKQCDQGVTTVPFWQQSVWLADNGYYLIYRVQLTYDYQGSLSTIHYTGKVYTASVQECKSANANCDGDQFAAITSTSTTVSCTEATDDTVWTLNWINPHTPLNQAPVSGYLNTITVFFAKSVTCDAMYGSNKPIEMTFLLWSPAASSYRGYHPVGMIAPTLRNSGTTCCTPQCTIISSEVGQSCNDIAINNAYCQPSGICAAGAPNQLPAPITQSATYTPVPTPSVLPSTKKSTAVALASGLVIYIIVAVL